MSVAVYPTLVGLAYNVVRRPKGNTSVQPHVSGRETRLGYWTYPMYEWDLTYSVLRDFQPCPDFTILSELKRLEGFYLAMQGSLTGFFYLDPDDNTVTGQFIATADGTSTDYLVVRTWGDASYGATVTEPVGDCTNPTVYLNGIEQTLNVDYTVGSSVGANLLIFASPPAAGVTITIDMTYLFYVRFKEDSLDFEKFSGPPGAGFWTVKKLTLQSLRAVPGIENT